MSPGDRPAQEGGQTPCSLPQPAPPAMTAPKVPASCHQLREFDSVRDSLADLLSQLQDIDPGRLSFSPFLDLDTQISLAPVSDSPESSIEELRSASEASLGPAPRGACRSPAATGDVLRLLHQRPPQGCVLGLRLAAPSALDPLRTLSLPALRAAALPRPGQPRGLRPALPPHHSGAHRARGRVWGSHHALLGGHRPAGPAPPVQPAPPAPCHRLRGAAGRLLPQRRGAGHVPGPGTPAPHPHPGWALLHRQVLLLDQPPRGQCLPGLWLRPLLLPGPGHDHLQPVLPLRPGLRLPRHPPSRGRGRQPVHACPHAGASQPRPLKDGGHSMGGDTAASGTGPLKDAP